MMVSHVSFFSLENSLLCPCFGKFSAAPAVWVEFFIAKGGGAAKRVIFNVISGLFFWAVLQV